MREKERHLATCAQNLLELPDRRGEVLAKVQRLDSDDRIEPARGKIQRIHGRDFECQMFGNKGREFSSPANGGLGSVNANKSGLALFSQIPSCVPGPATGVENMRSGTEPQDIQEKSQL